MSKVEIINRITINLAGTEDPVEGAEAIDDGTEYVHQRIREEIQGMINRANEIHNSGLRFVRTGWDWYEDL